MLAWGFDKPRKSIPYPLPMSDSPASDDSVLILGAGVHGAAIARELVLNGVGVHVVEKFDLAYGATSKSSRLIHGGLRYLEYGDFRLVRESLQARARNLKLAPQFVHPLRLFIPTVRRWSGLLRSALGFFGATRTSWGRRFSVPRVSRGYWPTRIGLAMYDVLSARGSLPKSAGVRVVPEGTPRVNPRRYRWMCSYWDAQIQFPERLVIALLAETQQVAAERGVPFRLSTYSTADVQDGEWRLHDTLTDSSLPIAVPRCVVNATGAWGDGTLAQLKIEEPPLFGGTKGTHFVTYHRQLREALNGYAVYAEADDGRLVFVLPFGVEGTLVGTTDETFAAKPETAAATEEELAYLLQLVNEVMDCRLTWEDITLHYSGVRPLPRSHNGDNAAISRDRAVVEHHVDSCPILTLVGGKLTTWHEFAEQVGDKVLNSLGRSRQMETSERPVLGAVDRRGRAYPSYYEQFKEYEQAWRKDYQISELLIFALYHLYGMRIEEILDDCLGKLGESISGTPFTTGIVRWIIDHESARTLSDLVERRLMLVFAQTLTRETLADLADCLVEAGVVPPADRPREIESTIDRLATYYGRRI